MPTTLNVAVIGCGRAQPGKVGWAIGHSHAVGWLSARPDVVLHGVDVSSENLAEFGRAFRLPEAQLHASTDELYGLLTPDCVSVCTWPALHAPLVIEAAERGVRGIVCEKPMALDVGQMRAMLRACEQTGTRLAIGHQRNHSPMNQLGKRLLHAGEIGDGWVFEGRVGDGWDMLSWTTHWLAMAIDYFDGPPRSILAGVDHTGERLYGHAIENASVVFADFGPGRQAIFVTGPEALPATTFLVRGNDGLMLFADGAVHIFNRHGHEVHHPPSTDYLGDFGALMANLIAVLGTDAPLVCDARHLAAATEMACAAAESARTRRTLTLPLATEFAPLEVLHHRPRLEPGGSVLLLADDHFGSGGRDGLAGCLHELTGAAPRVWDVAEPLTAHAMGDAAVLVLYHTQSEPLPETAATLTAWVAAGKPMLLVHAALGAWPQWEAYQRWCGRVWVWDGPEASAHPHTACELQVRPQSPLRPDWTHAWLPRDEVFTQLGETAPVHVAVEAVLPDGRHPAAWRHAELPHVAAWVPGHRGDQWTVPAMRQGLAAVLRTLVFG